MRRIWFFRFPRVDHADVMQRTFSPTRTSDHYMFIAQGRTGWVTLDELAEFLTSDDAPAGCMDLSELDGFLAGLLAGPEEVPRREWLDEIWSEEAPADSERDAVEQAILDRYEVIKAGLDASVLAYEPILWVDGGGSVVSEDWAAGFMQAVSLRAAEWQPALADEDTSALLIPIASLAGMTLDEDERLKEMLPDDALDGLMEDAVKVLPVCVLGLRRFWQGLALDGGTVRH